MTGSKVSMRQIERIRKLNLEGISVRKISAILGIGKSTVHALLHADNPRDYYDNLARNNGHSSRRDYYLSLANRNDKSTYTEHLESLAEQRGESSLVKYNENWAKGKGYLSGQAYREGWARIKSFASFYDYRKKRNRKPNSKI